MITNHAAEWLEPDGLGGFASGTSSGIRTRRYHALLLSAVTPPTGRQVLVNGFDAWIDTGSGPRALSSQRYSPDVVSPDGASRIVSFTHRPWPTWELMTADGCRVIHELLVEHGTGRVVMTWRVTGAQGPVSLGVRLYFSGRDYHSMHHANPAFRFEPRAAGARLVFEPYAGVPPVGVDSNARYSHQPDWYRNFQYDAERARGLDFTEDLASPGEWTWQLADGERAVMMLSASPDQIGDLTRDIVEARASAIAAAERRRREALGGPLEQSADAYIVSRGHGRTIVAGYPWFTDWGRDTFIAIRGLCLSTGRLEEARDILIEWAGSVSEGMLPNRFSDAGEAPEFNSVDASLWYVVAVGELLRRAPVGLLSDPQRQALRTAVDRIVSGYSAGTRFGIRADEDGLLASGAAGYQLTWMDARVEGREITPRIGKPVEIQALWINALAVAAGSDPKWMALLETAQRSFADRFWIEETGMLADVVDVDHVRGTRDGTCRPNQILAVGGLPLALIEGERAARVVEGVERHLLTPLGLRTLAPFEHGYVPHYRGGPAERDASYHQGTAWPWLLGPFVEAWVRVRGGTATARQEARDRFLVPVLTHLGTAGLGHVSEIVDAEAPHTPQGCPFQAWSLGELLRLERDVVGVSPRRSRRASSPSVSSRSRQVHVTSAK
jgi:predicted glycogen debranching enzyme